MLHTHDKVNRCDLASAKLELKAMDQENKRLLSKARKQAGRIRKLEVSYSPIYLRHWLDYPRPLGVCRTPSLDLMDVDGFF